MTFAEELGINMLLEFVYMAKEVGISYRGCDMELKLQDTIIDIVEGYISEVKNG